MDPVEICRRLGAPRSKGLFLELTTEAMKKILREAKLPTTRLASHTTTRRRNDDWANKVWHSVADKGQMGVAATLLFEWLTRSRRPMLAAFLDAIGVQHDHGLTDADFMTSTPPEKLVEAGRKLFEGFDKAEAAAYLAFLDASNKSEIFQPLDLSTHLATPLATQPAPGEPTAPAV
jgi:hypothetical protein